jgi:ribose 5-phosphate isomerase B
MARLSREHNNANVLALGARIVGFDLAIDIVETWLKTEFLGDRHQRRLDKIEDIEKKYGR